MTGLPGKRQGENLPVSAWSLCKKQHMAAASSKIDVADNISPAFDWML